jgi:hypothetical protein
MPSRIDSRIPGTNSRNRVSWIASQASAETSTAPFRFPEISKRLMRGCGLVDQAIQICGRFAAVIAAMKHLQ